MSKSFKRGDVVNFNNENFVIIKRGKDRIDVFNLKGAYRDGIEAGNYISPTSEDPFKVVTGKVDGYSGVVLKRGKEQYISVGCRVFNKLSEAKAHWSNSKKGYHYYPVDSSGYYESNEKEIAERKNANTKRYEATKALVAKMKEI